MGVVHSQRRCYVHVGTPKTGTTYLQSLLWASRDRLAEQGVELPLDSLVDHFHVALVLRDLLEPGIDPPHAFTALDRLAAALPAMRQPRVLISHEWLAPCTRDEASRLHAALEGFEIHIVITARDLARQIPSDWQQCIQQRQVLTYAEFLRGITDPVRKHEFWRYHDVADIAARWRGPLPADHVHIVTVPVSGSAPGLLLKRFCSLLDLDPGSLSATAPRDNPSLGAVQAEVLRRVNVALGDRLGHSRAGYGRVGKRYLAGKVLAPQPSPPLSLPAHLADWCQHVSADTVRQLSDARYDVVGDLRELMPTWPTAQTAAAEVSDADVAESAVQALASMLEQRHLDLERLGQLRERVRSQEARIQELEGAQMNARLLRAPAWPLRRLGRGRSAGGTE